MERPFGLTLIAAYFFLQGLAALASGLRASGRETLGPAIGFAVVGALFVAAGSGLARMRKWGRALAIALAVAGLLLGLVFRIAGVPPLLAFAQMVIAGLVLIYLLSHPSRFHFR